MTYSSSSVTTVVTPHKVHRDRKVRARLLHRALGVSPRVFRCLSNRSSISTTNQQPPASNHHSVTSTDNGNTSIGSNDVSSPRSAALKYTFRPPAAEGPRQQHEQNNQVVEQQQNDRSPPRIMHFQGLIDRSSIYQRPICFVGRRERYALALALHRRQLQQQQQQNNVSDAEKEHHDQPEQEIEQQKKPIQHPAAHTHQEERDEDAENESRTKKVMFQPIISILSIPSHRDYPEPMKRAMWGSLKEIKANAIRNTAEYMHDKCSWRQATEEDHMYLDSRSGNLIHPVHVRRYYAAVQAQREKQQQEQQMEELKRKRSHDEEEDWSEDDKEVEDEEMPSCEDHDSHRSCLKPIRACSPSPIRRRQQQQLGHTTPSPSSSPVYRHHQPKRLRIHCAPMPCSPNLYSRQQQMQYMQQQHHHMLQQQQESMPHSYYRHRQHHPVICNSRMGPVPAGPCSYPY